jgi:hypothetical protein
LSPLAWVQWRLDWPSTPGRHVARVRATDGAGRMQTPEERGVFPRGATGYHSMEFDIY